MTNALTNVEKLGSHVLQVLTVRQTNAATLIANVLKTVYHHLTSLLGGLLASLFPLASAGYLDSSSLVCAVVVKKKFAKLDWKQFDF